METLSYEEEMLALARYDKEKKNMLVAYILWFFLGGLGVHRFYLGKIGSGILMLALNVVGWATLWLFIGFIPLMILGFWLLIDAVLTFKMTNDKNKKIERSIVEQIRIKNSYLNKRAKQQAEQAEFEVMDEDDEYSDF